MHLIAQLFGFIRDDKDVRSAAFTFLGTTTISGVSYILAHYDKLLAASLSLAGLLFLLWRWRKASQQLLCDRHNCPRRINPDNHVK